ncbi:unnamed protein product [Pylaiella littoralis]
MVQFSLKLEDNRVDKWSSQYLDYRKLKKAIKQLALARRTAAIVAHRQSRSGTVSVPPDQTLPSAAIGGNEAPSSQPDEATGLLSSNTLSVQGIYDSATSTASGERPGCRSVGFADTVELASFENLLGLEIDKVEKFYTKVVDDLEGELTNLDPTVQIRPAAIEGDDDEYSAHGSVEGYSAPWVMKAKPQLDRKSEDSLRRALLDLYRNLTLLQNFAIINYTAVIKITKKYDKQVVQAEELRDMATTLDPAVALTDRMLVHLHQQEFYELRKLKSVTSACEAFFAGIFCGGNLAQARGMMLPQKTDERIDLAQFQLGYRLGMAAVLAFWILWDCCLEPGSDRPRWQISVLLHPAFVVYRALAGILLLRWCWGVSSFVWGRARINYIYLFDMDPRAVSSPLQVFDNVAVDTVVYLANLLLYYKMVIGRFPMVFPAGCVPLVLCLYVLSQVVLPFRKAKEFWQVILRSLMAPLCKVDFFATYVTDVMTSSVKTTQDVAWSVCFFLSGDFLLSVEDYHGSGGSWQRTSSYVNLVIPALCILPLWLRFQQCIRRYHDTQKRFPHLANCLKYCMSFTVALFGVFTPPHSTTTAVRILWFVMYVVSTLYTFSWDVLQDWGLGYPAYGFLRKKRLFSNPSVYYAAVVVDFLLRFNWLYSLIPPGHNPLPFIHSSTLPVVVTTNVIVLEFLRRTMWGFFRVENEHLNNTEGYRSTDHVPLHFHTPTARDTGPRKKGALVIGEVLGVTAAGIAMATAAVLAARDQMGAGP